MGLAIISSEVGPILSEVAKTRSGRKPVIKTTEANIMDLKIITFSLFFIALEMSNIYLL